MATNYHTGTYLLQGMKRRGLVPTSQNTFTDAEFLEMASEELRTYIVPLLSGVRERYGISSSTQTITAGMDTYDVPTRAIGANPERVLILDGDKYVPVDRLEPEREHDFGTSGAVAGYILRGNRVQLVPNPASSGTLKFEYFQRPSRIVATSAVAEVSVAAAAGATSVTVTATVPSTFTTSETYDFVSGTPHFNTTAVDLTPSAVSGTTWSYASGIPVALAKGDFICLANESPIPQCPVELHPLLAQRTAYKVWESLGNSNKAMLLKASCNEMLGTLKGLLSPRAAGNPRYIVNRNGPGWGRRAWKRV